MLGFFSVEAAYYILSTMPYSCNAANAATFVIKDVMKLTPCTAEASTANLVAKAPGPFFGLSKKPMSCNERQIIIETF
jgi:hypothetical protein